MELILKPALSGREIGLARPEALKIIVLYQEMGFVGTVVESLRVAGHRIHFPGKLFCALWNFDFVAEPLLSRIAAREGLAADMVLIALRSSEQLPVGVKHWLKIWSCKRERVLPKAEVSHAFGQICGCSPSQVARTEQIGHLGNIDLLIVAGAASDETTLISEIACVLAWRLQQALDLAVESLLPGRTRQDEGDVIGVDELFPANRLFSTGAATSLLV